MAGASLVTEITLHNGTVVRVQPAPQLAAVEVVSRDPSLATPPIPMAIRATKFGERELPVKEGEPEWEAYTKEVDRVKRERLVAQSDFVWDYGVVEWKMTDEDEWRDEPPDDWEFPSIMQRYGISPSRYGRRVDYIKYVLLQHGDDLTKVQQIVYGLSSPVTREEVDAVAELF